MRQFAGSKAVSNVTSVWASTETKAIEAAGLLAARLGLGVRVAHDLGENDRSSTGYLPPSEFEQVANAFFAQPEFSMHGWERAVDAQRRIRRTINRILAEHGDGDLAVVAHGAIGTLLSCSYLGQPINQGADQPSQGHYWIAGLPDRSVLQGWQQIAPF